MAEKGVDGEKSGRIVVGIDGSSPSLKALQWAVRQAELTNSSLEIVSTWEWPDSFGWGLAVPADYNPSDDVQGMLDEALRNLLNDHPTLVATGRVISGHPAPQLVDASKGADLLVVGNRGHGEFLGMVLGSVSEHCVANAHCPVLVYREAD